MTTNRIPRRAGFLAGRNNTVIDTAPGPLMRVWRACRRPAQVFRLTMKIRATRLELIWLAEYMKDDTVQELLAREAGFNIAPILQRRAEDLLQQKYLQAHLASLRSERAAI